MPLLPWIFVAIGVASALAYALHAEFSRDPRSPRWQWLRIVAILAMALSPICQYVVDNRAYSVALATIGAVARSAHVDTLTPRQMQGVTDSLRPFGQIRMTVNCVPGTRAFCVPLGEAVRAAAPSASVHENVTLWSSDDPADNRFGIVVVATPDAMEAATALANTLNAAGFATHVEPVGVETAVLDRQGEASIGGRTRSVEFLG